ncbi:unnamed protein product, partial [Prorocentrum cordatum]
EMQQPLLVDDECAAGDAVGDEACGVKLLQTSASKQDGKGAAPKSIPDLAAEAGAAAARAAAEALLQRQSGEGAEEHTVDGGAQGSGSLDRATVRKTCGSTGSRPLASARKQRPGVGRQSGKPARQGDLWLKQLWPLGAGPCQPALLLLCGSLTAPRAQEMQQPLLVDDECDAAGDEACGVKMLQTSASKQDGKGAAPKSIPDLAAEAGAAAARAAAEALLQRQSGEGAEAAAAMVQEHTVDGGAQGSGSLDRATVRKTCGSTGSRC